MEKRINIVKKGLAWNAKTDDGIDINRVAHPVDRAIISVLEKFKVASLLRFPMEQLVSAYYGQTLANGVVLDENNFPELYDILMESVDMLGIEIPYTVITNEISGINAAAMGTDERPFVIISNLAPKLLSKQELQFIVAHECGHVAMQHMTYHTAGNLAGTLGQLVPVLGPAIAEVTVFPLNYWNRCSEITSDRIGLLVCGDLETAQRALLKIVGGFTELGDVDISHYIRQSRQLQETQLLGRLREYFSTHPMVHKRLKALELFSDSMLYYQVAGKEVPEGKKLLTDEELKRKTNDLLSVL